MRTIDANSYIQNKLAAEIARYPAGSVSKREVIFNIEHDDEETYAKLDRALTKLVYDEAIAASQLRIPPKFTSERDRLTDLAQQAISSSCQA